MTRAAQRWLKPPGTLLLALFLLTLGSVSALAWFSWQFLQQEALVEAQRGRQHLEESSDRLTTDLRGALAETADRLTSAEALDSGILLMLSGSEITLAKPVGKLLYTVFGDSVEFEENTAAFAEAEMFEFVQSNPAEAFRLYERLSIRSTEPTIRTGAVFRMARALGSAGRTTESRAAWQRVASSASSSFVVGGVPAQLAALVELGNATEILNGLRSGRWKLTRSQFEYFWSAATRMAGSKELPPADAVAASEAAARVWRLLSDADAPARGQEILWTESQPWLVVWRGTGDRRAVLLAKPDQWFRSAVRLDYPNVQVALLDAQGRTIAGRRPAGNARAAVRPAVETQLPWTIYAASTATGSVSGLLLQQRYLLSGLAVMVCFLIVGTYFIGRAIRREAEVARMQSDFVSSVSHEFRSPLTTMRQLSEILALGRAPSEERRQLYYETLVRETTRLQRVVEALLKFGQMESGASRYRFEPVEVTSVIEQAVADYRQQPGGRERLIEVHDPGTPCTVHADSDAIGVALRNLLDNAVKYSPETSPVVLEWGRKNGNVAIAVSDSGPGVAAVEQRTIFDKFVRGTAAATGNVKGSGLGLSMVRHIVAAHKGEVLLTSTPGHGSTFTILLPFTEAIPEEPS